MIQTAITTYIHAYDDYIWSSTLHMFCGYGALQCKAVEPYAHESQ